MKKLLCITVLCVTACQTMAASSVEPVRLEVEALLSKLRSSGCTFKRNGSWHSAPEAASHLLRKLDYIERKSPLKSTEQFIELAATQSSSSGTPYRVQCGAEPATPSKQWLEKQLGFIRSEIKNKQP